MKRKLKGFGVGLALAAMLTTVANATLTVYNWVPDASTSDNGANSSGTLEIDNSLLSSVPIPISLGDPDFYFTLDGTPAKSFNNFSGYISLLSDGNLQLIGQSSGGYLANWTNNASSGSDENEVSLSSDPDFGDWVPEVAVPEPSTIIAGMLLLLPLGASTLRLLRKNRTA